MARRARSPRKEKPVKAKAKPKAKGRGRRAAGADFQVTEQDEGAEKASAWSLESGLVVVTTLALLTALVLVELEMLDSYGSTWPF